jgi:hypothetical protein
MFYNFDTRTIEYTAEEISSTGSEKILGQVSIFF